MPSHIPPEILQQRRQYTQKRLTSLQKTLKQTDAPSIVDETETCVYATGSIARGDASEHSDLDLFICSLGALSNIDATLLKADIIRATSRCKFPEFSGDGQYLVHYKSEDLVEKLGKQDDDFSNVLTARLLLLLESKPVLGGEVYKQIIVQINEAYWRDSDKNKDNFVPAFLTNDVIRYWKTLCINYEARTREKPAGNRRLKNYKLKYSRLLTCYSALLHLAHTYAQNRTVTKKDAVEMALITPTERLESVLSAAQDAKSYAKESLSLYSDFLEVTKEDTQILEKKFENDEFNRDKLAKAREFSQCIFKLLMSLSKDTDYQRFLIV